MKTPRTLIATTVTILFAALIVPQIASAMISPKYVGKVNGYPAYCNKEDNASPPSCPGFIEGVKRTNNGCLKIYHRDGKVILARKWGAVDFNPRSDWYFTGVIDCRNQ
jgi:hypothetical protein